MIKRVILGLGCLAGLALAAGPFTASATAGAAPAAGKSAAAAAADGGRPKLVLAIVVDQLRTDYLESLRPLFARGGFARLMQEGAYLRNVEFAPSRLDIASSTAMLMTGATPDKTGVPSASTWNAAKMTSLPALTDPEAMGNFTSAAYSPHALRLSTVTDEVMIDGAGLGVAYSIAADPQQAIILASHAGTSALWLDRNTGKWASSSYYKDMPQPASQRNYSRPLSARLDTMQWKPLLPLDSYPGLPAQKRYYNFGYTFPSSAKDAYERFAASPKCNTEVTDLALDYLRTLRPGARGDAMDMLCVGYTLAPFKYVKDADFRLELSDAYVRLDRDLARLIETAEKTVGAGNVLVVLLSTGYYNDAAPDAEKYRIPGGTFSVKRAISLLNAFLTSRHGQGNYVEAWADGAFYLSHKLLEQKGLDTQDVARACKEFLLRMSGVESVNTMSELLSANTASEDALRMSVDPRSSADLLVEITPGWLLCEDNVYPERVTPVRRGRYLAPAFFMGRGISAQSVAEPVEATALAPTLSTLLRLRQPNGAQSRPLLLSK